MEGLVVRSWKDAERLMEDRPILFPLDSIRVPQTPPSPRGPGILGLASDQVKSADRFRHLLQALLGHTLIVEDLATARRLHQEDAAGFQFVTLEGELLTPQGALVAGAPQFEGLERVLEREMTSLEEEKPHIREELRGEKERHNRLLSEMQTLEKRAQELGARLGAKEGDLSEHKTRLERLLQEVEWRQAIEAKAREELEQIRASIADLSLQVERSEAQEKDALAALARLQERMATWGAEGEESMAHLALLKERKENLEQLEAQIEAKEARKRDLAEEIETLAKEVEALEARAQELSTRLTALQGLIEPAEEELTSLERRGRRQEKEEAHLRDDLHRCEVEHSQAILEIERRKDRLAALQGQIETDLEDLLVTPLPKQLTLGMDARLVSLPSISQIPQGLEKKIRRLKRRLRKIGPVNLEAPAEYEQIKSRHDFLTSQAEDLEKAARSLRQMIAELNRLMEERFQETFSAIAKEFSHYFTALFNGGRGKLLLTDPQDPSQTGVEIVAQAPGKRRQSIDLLSGGERALTGVALVFAILKATATPFCFLDEVDATLDEINIGRFRDSLKALAQATQIVIITHNRYTIEAADTIYGLSLGEDSASQVISLRLEDVET
jgi:chromosome segregation protein